MGNSAGIRGCSLAGTGRRNAAFAQGAQAAQESKTEVMTITIRTMHLEDMAAVHAVQCRAHPDYYHEPPDALASRLALGQAFCLVAEVAGEVCAYFLAHPWLGEPPALHEGLPTRLPEAAQHLFLHDMAVRPDCQGRALGSLLYAAMCERAAAHGFMELRLVAVGEARQYWERLGFEAFAAPTLHASYGDAQLMRRMLGGM